MAKSGISQKSIGFVGALIIFGIYLYLVILDSDGHISCIIQLHVSSHFQTSVASKCVLCFLKDLYAVKIISCLQEKQFALLLSIKK